MVVALLAFALGVVLVAEFAVPLWICATAFTLSLLLLIILRRGWLALVVVASMAMTLDGVGSRGSCDLSAEATKAVAYTFEYERSVWARLRGWITFDGEWHSCDERVCIVVTGDVDMAAGDMLTVCGELSSMREPYSSFERSVMRQGAKGVLRFYSGEVIEHQSSKGGVNSWMHQGAMERLSRLDVSPQALALSQATTLGSRTNVERQIWQLYVNSGVQHLLAISGLHIGVVLLLAILLFTPLVLLTHGQLWRAVAVILSLWAFVFATTMPVSLIRAAVMFTMLYISMEWGRRYSAINGLAATALMFLVINTRTLYDVGFQLSMVAVAAILTLHYPIKRFLRGRLPSLVSIPLEVVTVGVVATLAVTPIVSAAFGYFSLLSPLSTLPMLPLIYITVSTSLLWIVLPLPLWQPVAEWIVEWSYSMQHAVVAWVSQIPLSRVDFRMSEWGVVLFYLALFAISYLISRKNGKK